MSSHEHIGDTHIITQAIIVNKETGASYTVPLDESVIGFLHSLHLLQTFRKGEDDNENG